MKISLSARLGATASALAFACLACNSLPAANAQQKVAAKTLSATARTNFEKQYAALKSFKASLSFSQRKLPATLLLAQNTTSALRARASLPKFATGTSLRSLQLSQSVVLRGQMTPRIKAAIEREGTLTGFFPEYGTATALLSTTAMQHLATATEVKSIKINPGSKTNSAVAPVSSVSALVRAISTTTGKKVCSGSVTSEGDVTHQAKLARDTYKANGSGIKVGVISDSAEYIASLKSQGELPGDASILAGQAGSGTSEGSAMMEIVYDLAPGAKIEFASRGNSPEQMARNIIALQKDGCKVIVDDISFFAEPAYQDGVIAQAITQVTAAGAVYLTSIGNSGNINIGPTSTWDNKFQSFTAPNGAIFNSWTGKTTEQDSIFNGIAEGNDGSGLSLQWAEPMGKAANDYDLILTDSSGNVINAGQDVQDGDDDPQEFIYTGSLAEPGTYVVVARASGTKALPMRLFVHNSHNTLQYSVGPTGFGHNVCESCLSIGAAPSHTAFGEGEPAGPYPNAFNAGSKIETFSSNGKHTIYFSPTGAAQTRTINKPDITAADGAAGVTKGFNPFFGTSAAAPHAAAIAALAWSQNPSQTGAKIRQRMLAGTIDTEKSGYDDYSGYGIVMAPLVMKSFTPTATPTPKPTSTPVPSSSTVAFSEPTYSVKENAGTATITVKRSGSNTKGAISVKYQTTTGGTATLNTDYKGAGGTLVWAGGDVAAKTFKVTIVDDKVKESSETVKLRLYDASSGTTILSTRQTATLTIVDNDTSTTDSTPPTVAISTPANSSTVGNIDRISGTASDTGGSTLKTVTVSIRRSSDGAYWDGNKWSSTVRQLLTTLSGGSWSRTSLNPPKSALSEGTLIITALATDGAGNTATATSRPFVDASAPTVSISTPSNNVKFSATGFRRAAGKAFDGGSDANVFLYLQRAKDSKYWTGSTWGSTTQLGVQISASGEWSRTGWPASLAAGSYTLTAVATDSVGNTSIATSTFTVGTTKAASGSGSDS